jgi:hypothetical protein
MMEAAHYWHYEWAAFDALEGDEQALYIAHYRTKQRFLAVDAWANRPKPEGVKKRGIRARRRRA